MRRAFSILIALYFPLFLTLALQFYPEVSPDVLESEKVKFLALLWLGDGLGVLALSLALLKQQISLPRGGRSAGLIVLFSLSAPLGVVPAYLALDLGLKLCELWFP